MEMEFEEIVKSLDSKSFPRNNSHPKVIPLK